MTNAEEGLPEEGRSLQKGEKAEDGGLPPQKGEKAEEGLVEVGGIPLQKGEKAEDGGLRLPPQKGEKADEEGLLVVQKGKGFRNSDLNRGDELKTLAEEKNDDIYSKAKLYNTAGIRYTLAKSWTAAAGMLGKSAECYKELGKSSKCYNEIECYKYAAQLFLDAGEASLKIFDKDAMDYFNQAVELLIESNDVSQAEKYCKRIGALYKYSRQYDDSLLFYKRWVDLCEATHDAVLIRESKNEFKAATRRLKEGGDPRFDGEACCVVASIMLLFLAICLLFLYAV